MEMSDRKHATADEDISLTICDLPDELLLTIFKKFVSTTSQREFVKNVVPVCKRFWRLSSESEIWRELTNRDLNVGAMWVLAQKGVLGKTRKLFLNGDHVSSFFQSRWSIPPGFFSQLPHLRLLNMRNYDEVDDEVLDDIVQNCTRLISFKLSFINVLSNCTLKLNRLLTFPNGALTDLHLEYVQLYDGCDLLGGIARNCPLLENLVIAYVDFENGVKPIVDITQLLIGCGKLERLVVRHATVFFDTCLSDKLKRPLKLQSLELNHVYYHPAERFTSGPLDSLFRGCGKNLRFLKLFCSVSTPVNCSDLTFSGAIGENCPLLQELDCGYMTVGHEREVIPLFNVVDLLKGCRKLEHLELRSLKIVFDGTSSFSGLTSLHLRGIGFTQGITLDLLITLLNGCGRKLKTLGLWELVLTCLDSSSSKSLQSLIAKKCPALKELKLGHVRLVDVPAENSPPRRAIFDLAEILTGCVKLERLFLKDVEVGIGKTSRDNGSWARLESFTLSARSLLFGSFVRMIQVTGTTLRKLLLSDIKIYNCEDCCTFYETVAKICPRLEKVHFLRVFLVDENGIKQSVDENEVKNALGRSRVGVSLC